MVGRLAQISLLLTCILLAGCPGASNLATSVAWQVAPGVIADVASAVSSKKSESPPSNANTIRSLSASTLCESASNRGRWETNSTYLPHVAEARRRGLNCGVAKELSMSALCGKATVSSNYTQSWAGSPVNEAYVAEAKRRGLSCGVGESIRTANTANSEPALALINVNNSALCRLATNKKGWETKRQFQLHVTEAKRRGLGCGVIPGSNTIQRLDFDLDSSIIKHISFSGEHVVALDLDKKVFYYHNTYKDSGYRFNILINYFSIPENKSDGHYALTFTSSVEAKNGSEIPWEKAESIESVKSSTGKDFLKVQVKNFKELLLAFEKAEKDYFRVRITSENGSNIITWSGLYAGRSSSIPLKSAIRSRQTTQMASVPSSSSGVISRGTGKKATLPI